GQRLNPLSVSGLKGFATGGLIKSPMMAMLGEEDEEIVIPTARNRRTDAMKLLALAAKKIGADNGSFNRSVTGTGQTDDSIKEMIVLLMEQNKYLKKSNDLLTALLGKDLDLHKL